MIRILLMPLMWLINTRPYNLKAVHPGDYILWKNELWQFVDWEYVYSKGEMCDLKRNDRTRHYYKRGLHDARTLSAWELKARQDADKATMEASV